MIMKQVKVNGTVCTFNEEEHTYTVNGEQVPGTTSITGIVDKSAPIKWWAVGEAKDYIMENFEDHIDADNPFDEVAIQELADSARTAHMSSSNKGINIGTLVHQYAEDYVQHLMNGIDEPEFPNNEEAQESAIEFLSWMDEHDVEPVATEQMVFHPDLGYAGTYDLKAFVDGELLVVDYKTGSGIYEEHYAQVTAYYEAEKLRTDDETIDGIAIVRFPKDSAGFEVETITDDDELDEHWEAFKGCKKVFDWQEQN
jgi:hypothetical protein